jgi:protein-tyrosine-phosphatase/DNA-binding transcriptional ArsR family regulator
VASALESPHLLRVVGDPHRWAILTALAGSDRRVGELTEMIGERQNLVSYHLRELRDAGLVSSRRSSFDRRDTYYRLAVDRCGEVFRQSAEALHPALRLVPDAVSPPRRAGRAPRVLFLCTGNSARSQMAEALLEHRSGGAAKARSAGSHPKVLHPHAVRVMAARDIDISGNQTKHLDRFARSQFDEVITLCDKVREVCPDFPGEPAARHWSMPDPSDPSSGGGTLEAFERSADELEARVRDLIPQLLSAQGGPNDDR